MCIGVDRANIANKCVTEIVTTCNNHIRDIWKQIASEHILLYNSYSLAIAYDMFPTAK